MFRFPLRLAALAAFLLTTPCRAQILPPLGAAEQAAAMTQPLATGPGGCRAQFFYPAAWWTSQSITTPIELRQLHFRAEGFAWGNYGCLHDVSVFLSTRTAAPTPGFATNHGTNVINAWSGDLWVTPAWGTSPNNWVLSVPVRPFQYDPSLGDALVVDIVVPHGCPTGLGIAVDAVNAGTSCTGGPDAVAGAIVGTVPVLNIDYDVVPATRARADRFGFGCSNRPTGLHEYFDANNAFDLSGSSIVFSPLAPGWTAAPGTAWKNHTSPTTHVLADDALSGAVALPFSFPLPPLLCTTGMCPNLPDHARFFRVESNGSIWFTNQVDVDPSPTPREFVRNGPRIAPLWTDLDPSAGGSVLTEVILGNPVITWLNVPQKGNPLAVNSVQLELFPTGAYEVRYLAVLTTGPILV
ncbi:MAG: hypothetical protein JNK15_13520, partial [Planctomycetes bacterium]|nr:hypothetical protein [Planctomycetota bacterium]